MDRKRQPSNYPVTPAAMSQSRFLNPASALLPQNVAHDRAMSEPVGPCRKCRCQEGAPASWRRSEAAIPELKGRRSVGPALVGCLHLPSGPFAPLLATTLVYAEKVRPQFLSLRQLRRSLLFSARECWKLSPVLAAISDLGSGLLLGRVPPFFSKWLVSLQSSGLYGFGTILEIRVFQDAYEF